ncbi:Pfk26 [Kluyveromyces lactis]|nr:Pfk26 [Kluyveromyces lactis]
MFRRVSFSEHVLVSSSDSELEPTQSIEDKRHDQATQLKMNENEDGIYEVDNLPQFQKRPLSDTPVVSRFQSPSSSVETSAETSPQSSRSASPTGSPVLGPVNEDQLSSENGYQSGAEDWQDQSMLENLPPSHMVPKRRPTTIDVPGLTKSKTSPDGIISQKDPGSKLIIIMVGLPATGKSFITNKLSRYLNYSMYYCKVFNVGNTRRQFAKEHNMKEQDSKFFDPDDEHSKMLRNKWALDTLDQLLEYLLNGPGSVGIFDATNSTKERRRMILKKIHERNKFIKVLFLESICSDKETVEKNIRMKLLGPDYKGKDPESSLSDFKGRLSNYMKKYETIEDDENVPYIKMIDIGKKIVSYDIQGFLASQTVYYLLNFNLAERQIWITRSGESEFNVSGKIGGDSQLTKRGLKYAKALARFMEEQRKLFNENQMKEHLKVCTQDTKHEFTPTEFFVWTSMKKRAMATACTFNDRHFDIKQMKMLDELSAGDFDGLTYEEILLRSPEEYEERLLDKLRYRYPGIGGESYMDVINRLRPVITEIERITDNLLIVTHRVVARVLLGYFLNLSKDVITNLDVPLHSVYCLEPKPYGVSWYLYEYNEETDTFSKVPHTDLNTTKVKEVGLVHQERRYSIIPTAPSSATSGKSRSVSHSSSFTTTSSGGQSSNRLPHNLPHSSSTNMSGASRSVHPARQLPPYRTNPSLLARTMSRNHSSDHVGILKRSVSPRELANSIELDKLNEKLSKLATNEKSKSDTTPQAPPLSRSQSETMSPHTS